jgi:hypothetical protein
MIANAAFVRPQRVIVLYAIAGENLHAAVVAHHGDAENQRTIGPLETRRDVLVQV